MSNQSKLLLLASIIGTFLAIYSIVDSNKNFSSLPNNVIAIVNDKIIPSERYRTVIQLIENDKRDDLTEADRKMALDRIIEEELLVPALIGMLLLISHSKPLENLNPNLLHIFKPLFR